MLSGGGYPPLEVIETEKRSGGKTRFKQTEIGEIPEEWEAVTVGELITCSGGEIKTGPFGTILSASEYSNEGVPLVAVKEIRAGYIAIHADTPRVPPVVVDRLKNFLLQAGDVVFARKGNVERCAVVTDDLRMMLGSDAIRLRLPSIVSPSFLGQYLQSGRHIQWMLRHATGSTMGGINQRVIERIPLLLPPLHEQREIAAILSSVDEAIHANQAVIEQIRRVKEGLLQELLTKGIGHTRFKQTEIGEIPEEWEVLSVERLFSVQLGKMLSPTAKSGMQSAFYLGNANVQWGEFRLHDLKEMNFDDAERKKFSLRDGDIIMCEGGEVGRCAIWRSEITECFFQKALHRLRPLKPGTIVPEFMVAFAELHFRGAKSSFVNSGQTTIAHLTREKLNRTPVAVPSLSEQRRIAATLSSVDEAITNGMKRASQFQSLKAGLLQDLLTGKVRVSL